MKSFKKLQQEVKQGQKEIREAVKEDLRTFKLGIGIAIGFGLAVLLSKPVKAEVYTRPGPGEWQQQEVAGELVWLPEATDPAWKMVLYSAERGERVTETYQVSIGTEAAYTTYEMTRTMYPGTPEVCGGLIFTTYKRIEDSGKN